jgi:hypothetical protein
MRFTDPQFPVRTAPLVQPVALASELDVDHPVVLALQGMAGDLRGGVQHPAGAVLQHEDHLARQVAFAAAQFVDQLGHRVHDGHRDVFALDVGKRGIELAPRTHHARIGAHVHAELDVQEGDERGPREREGKQQRQRHAPHQAALEQPLHVASM